MSTIKRVYLSTKIWFGKYKDKDKNVYQLILEDINYVDWLLDKAFEEYWIDDKVRDMFNKCWENRNYKKYGFRNDNLNK